MSLIGLDVSHRVAWPTPDEVRALRPALLRTVCYMSDELWLAVQKLQGTVPVCALVEGQTGGFGDPFHDGDWRGAKKAAAAVASIEGVGWVEMGNELDLWGIPVEMAVKLTTVMAPLIAARGKRPILTSVASSGWQEYLERLVEMLPREVAELCWANVHPYGRRALGFPAWFGWGADGWQAEAAYALERGRELTGLPCVASESGIKLGDANHDNNEFEDDLDDHAQAIFVEKWIQSFNSLDPTQYPFACYFAWADIVGTSSEQGEYAFGLRRHDWSTRPSWDVFSRMMGGVTPPEPPMYEFKLGFLRLKQWLGDAAGEPVENELARAARSEQATTTGLMSWTGRRRDEVTEYEPELLFYEFSTGRRYIIQEESGTTLVLDPLR
jgi:hypothetical protein